MTSPLSSVSVQPYTLLNLQLRSLENLVVYPGN